MDAEDALLFLLIAALVLVLYPSQAVDDTATAGGILDIFDVGDMSASGVSSDVDTLARTMWGEARGETQAGRDAVGCVVRNRLNSLSYVLYGLTYAAQCTAHEQFSCWNAGDVNRAQLQAVTESDAIFAECLSDAQGVIDGTTPDPTGGATNYFDTSMKNDPPEWAASMTFTTQIGRLLFYR